jgi:predicted Rossmann fold nucleotide-binding protein DprA/Smf involved in DNA uptake
MQRNKLIYALGDAALVVQSDYGKGGTWAGAIEQLERLRLVPVYTLPHAQQNEAFECLRKKGALTWPNPSTPEEFREVLAGAIIQRSPLDTEQLSFSGDNGNQSDKLSGEQKQPETSSEEDTSSIPPSDQLFATVRTLLERLDMPKTDKEIANELKVKTGQAREWIKCLVKEGTLQKLEKPTRYRSTKNSKLF